MKKVKVVLHHPANIFTLVRSLLTITVHNEILAQYDLIDIAPALTRTIDLKKLIMENKDNIYAEELDIDCHYVCTELEDRELLEDNFSLQNHDLTLN
tara:strand:- start:923 stop:1213 length:291 start_codon:yes stop_codon:yes gene_type:complete